MTDIHIHFFPFTPGILYPSLFRQQDFLKPKISQWNPSETMAPNDITDVDYYAYDEDNVDYGYPLNHDDDEDSEVDHEYGEMILVDQVPCNETSGIRKEANYGKYGRRHSLQSLRPNSDHDVQGIMRRSSCNGAAVPPRRSRRHSICAIGEGSRLYGNRMQRRVSFGDSSVVHFDTEGSAANLETESVASIPVKKPQLEHALVRRASASTMSSLSWLSSDSPNSVGEAHSPLAVPPPKWDASAGKNAFLQMPPRLHSPRRSSAPVALPHILLQTDLNDSWRSSVDLSTTQIDAAPKVPRRRMS